MKNMLKLEFVAAAALALAGTAAFPACALVRERPSEVVARMEVVEVDDRGYVRYQGEIVKPGEFANLIRARRDVVAGKPVLLSVNPAVYENQPQVVPYLRRVLESVHTGRVYSKIPRRLDEYAEGTEVAEVDARGFVRYRGETVKPGEFAERVRARQDALRGKRALIYADPAVYENQPEIMPYVIGVFEKAGAECAVDKTGK